MSKLRVSVRFASGKRVVDMKPRITQKWMNQFLPSINDGTIREFTIETWED